MNAYYRDGRQYPVSSFYNDWNGKKVRVYRNLNKPGFLSVKYKGKVVAYIDQIRLMDTRFTVSQASRLRVLRSPRHRKTVHAYVEGSVASWLRRSPRTACTYNPLKYDSFVVRSNLKPVHQARYCRVHDNQIFIR